MSININTSGAPISNIFNSDSGVLERLDEIDEEKAIEVEEKINIPTPRPIDSVILKKVDEFIARGPPPSEPTPKSRIPQTQPRKQQNVEDSNFKAKFKIQKYMDHPRLGDALQKAGLFIDKQYIRNMPSHVAQERLEEIRYYFTNRYSDVIVGSIAETSLQFYEKTMSMFYDVSGIGDTLNGMREYQEMIDEISVEFDLPKIPVQGRLLMLIAQTSIIQNQINSVLRSNPTCMNIPNSNQEISPDTHLSQSEKEQCTDDLSTDEQENDSPKTSPIEALIANL